MTDGDASNALREALAALCHEQWSGWMRCMFSKCVRDDDLDEADFMVEIPSWAVERWRRQIATPYAELTPQEREGRRRDADRFIALLERTP